MTPFGKTRCAPVMTDLHCHILPGLDDGAKSPKMTLQMAQQAAAAGVRQIVCTPHCTTGDPGLRQRLTRSEKAVEVLNYVFGQMKLPVTLYVGMELLCNDRLPETLQRREFLTLAGSQYLLIEFPFDVPLSRIEWAANAVWRAGYIPVLAHPERYTAVWRNPDCLSVWFYAGYVIQLDKDSVLGRFGNHCARTAAWALSHGVAHVIASDAHDTRTRTTSLQAIWQYVANNYSLSYANLLLQRNPQGIVQGRRIGRE